MSEVLEAGTVFANEWRVVKLLHAGAISHVYEAEQTSTGARRALKVVHAPVGIDPKFREAFVEEARRASRVQSEHVAEVLSCGIDQASDKPYVALELLEGPSLAAIVSERGALPPGEVLTLVTQLGHALTAAHDAGVIHRDLKPEGIILARSHAAGAPQRVEVQFVGAGKVASEALHNTTAAMGRPLWMAPEQSETDAKPSPATDVWTLGLLTFWLLTGRHYWKTGRDMGSAAMTLLREVLYEPLPPASQRAEELGLTAPLPPGFDEWFGRCVAREQEQRFAHARDAIRALLPLLQAVAPAVPLPPAAPAVAASVPPPRIPGPAHAVYKAAAPPRPGSLASYPAPAAASGSSGAVKLVLILAAVVAVLGLVAGGAYYVWQGEQAKAKKAQQAKAEREREEEREAERKKQDALKNWSDEESPVPVTAKDPNWGRREAPVTIVVFTDFECPFCDKHDKTLEELKARHGEEKLRVVYKHFPLPMHKNARRAHQLAEGVFRAKGSEAYLKFKAQAFANKSQLGGDEPMEWAKDLGLKQADFRENESEYDKKLQADIEVGTKIGVRGIPATFVNGIRIVGAQSAEKFDTEINAEHDKAKAEIAKGTLPDKVYVARSKENFRLEPEPDKDPPPDKDNDESIVFSVPLGDAPVLGPSTAKVTIVMFGDFECPFCAKSVGTLKDLRRDYGDRIRIAWKDNPLPFHKNAEPAAELARAVREQKGNDAFWKLHDLLFENQKALGESDLKVYAFRVGADPVKAMAAVKQKKFAPQIDADQRLADGLEATGTPAFFINGKRLAGAQSIDKFKAIIDREEALATAAMAAKSMSAEAYYDDLVKTGKTGTFETKTPGPIPAAAPRKGAKAPRVVVQWFADLECPFCARSNATIDEVLRDYGDRVQVVWRHLPLGFHPNARPAAMAAEEVRVQLGDEAFFVFVTGAFQKKKDAGALDRNALEAVAFDVSRSTTKPFSLGNLRVALDTDKHEARIKEDEEEAKRLGIAGTPSFLVGKYFVKGAVPYSKLKAAIDKALSD